MQSNEIYIRINENNVITTIHHNPLDPLEGLGTPRDELEKEGFFITELPSPEVIPGRRAVPKFNPDTKQVYYEYIEYPLSTAERVDNIEGLLNELLMGGKLNL